MTISADANSSPTRPAASHKATLVTVHGTGAGDVTAAGDRWWQLGSAFLNELGKRLDVDPSCVEISPFQWKEGPNSELARRAAGKALYERLKSYDESGVDYYVIGHSHGGSVVYTALLRSVVKRAPLKRLKCWCTVGTPFLDYRPNRFLFQRLKSLGLTFYTTGVVAFVLGVWVLFNLPVEDGNLLQAMAYSLMLTGILSFSGLWTYERFRKSWATRAQKRETRRLYAGLWLGLWHGEDEAISALSNVRTFSAPIISRTFLQPLVAIAQLMVVIVPGIYLGLDLSANGSGLKDIADEFLRDFVDLQSASSQEVLYGLTWMNFSMIIILVLPSIWVLTILLNGLAKVLGRPLASILNRVIWSSVRQRAWGDDVLKEDVRAIDSHPPEFAPIFGPLPDAVADPLRGHSEKHAVVTLHKVREVLGMTRSARTAPDLRSELSDNLKWQELIHTSYFDVPEFVDLVALGLHRAGLGELRDGFVLTAERQHLADWCQGASAPAAERP